VCVLVVILILDYSKLDKEIACLEQQKNNADAAEAATLEALLAARAKKNYLQKQRKLLVRCKQQWMDKLGQFVEEIKALEAVDRINQEVSLLKDRLMLGTLLLNWSAFIPSFLEGNSGFKKLIGASPSTAQVVTSSL
jgi:hypothetical protein